MTYRHEAERLYRTFEEGLESLHVEAIEQHRSSDEVDMLSGMLDALRGAFEDKEHPSVWSEMQRGLQMLDIEQREKDRAEYDRVLMRSE